MFCLHIVTNSIYYKEIGDDKKLKREPISEEYLLLGEKLKEIRISNNLTQEELSKIMEVGKGTVLNYEIGTRKAPITYLVRFAKYFQMSVDEILGTQKNIFEELTIEELKEVMNYARYLISKRSGKL